ncbi:Acetyltransferase (GNAT) family protein [uncultured archaeon]|nr:Acetyltransferase (GNAT) family protein [uncultured archaeon]
MQSNRRNIKKASKSDLPALEEIFRLEFSKPPYNEKWGSKLAAQKIGKYFRTCTIMVCREKKEIAGFIIFHTDYWFAGKICFIDELVVREAFRGKGAGSALLSQVEAEARKRKMKSTYLLALHGCPAQEFYEKHGYNENNWVLMRKQLNPTASI